MDKMERARAAVSHLNPRESHRNMGSVDRASQSDGGEKIAGDDEKRLQQLPWTDDERWQEDL